MVIDWGDASITNPLFELSVLDSYTPDWPAEATDRWLDLLGVDRSGWSGVPPSGVDSPGSRLPPLL